MRIESYNPATGETVKQYASVNEAARDAFVKSSISACINGKAKSHPYGKLGWRKIGGVEALAGFLDENCQRLLGAAMLLDEIVEAFVEYLPRSERKGLHRGIVSEKLRALGYHVELFRGPQYVAELTWNLTKHPKRESYNPPAAYSKDRPYNG